MTSSNSKTQRYVVIRDDMHGGYFVRDTKSGHDLRRTHNRLRSVVLAHATRMNEKANVEPFRAQRDVAFAVLVLVNDCNMTTDEALDELVARDAISDADKRAFSKRYWEVSRFIRPTVDVINEARS